MQLDHDCAALLAAKYHPQKPRIANEFASYLPLQGLDREERALLNHVRYRAAEVIIERWLQTPLPGGLSVEGLKARFKEDRPGVFVPVSIFRRIKESR